MPALQCSAVKCMYNKDNLCSKGDIQVKGDHAATEMKPGVQVLWKRPECPMLIHAEAAAALFRSDVQLMIVPITDRRYARRIMCTSMEARPVSVKKPAVERSGVNKAR